MKKTLSILSVSIIPFLSNAQTATIYRSGLPISPTYTTLKAALPNAINGDEIIMSAHKFNEYNDSIVNKTITIKGTISGADTTTIDGKGLGPVLVYMNTAATKDSLILRDFIITNGNNPVTTATSYTGGGIAAWGRMCLTGNFTVRNCISGGGGGGISNYGPTYIIGGEGAGTHMVKIHNNKLSYPIGRGGGIYTTQTDLIISGNVLINNNEAYTGAGIYSFRGSVHKILIDSKAGNIEIKNNKAEENGGGLFIASPPMGPGTIGTGVQFKGNIIIDGNTAKGKGGAIGNSDSMRLIGPGIQITNNQADGGGGAFYGHLKSVGGYTILDNVLVSGNSTALKGGGFYVDYNHNLQVNNSQIINNQANGAGAASALHNDNKTSINNTRIYNPTTTATRQLEVQNNFVLNSSQCWWGESDTTGLIKHNSMSVGSSFTLTNWVKTNWSVNNGSPIGAAASYPISATFTLNTGAALPASSFAMLQGKFTAPSGSFSPAIANNTAANKITSTYTRPSSGTSILWAVVDADSFKSNSDGLSIKSLSAAHNSFKIYPNPSQGILFIEGIQQDIAVKILGLQGQLIETVKLSANNSSINLSHYPQGIYLLQIENEKGGMEHYKIIKE